MQRYIILMIAVIGVLLGATRVYDIEPYQNCNGWSPQGAEAYVGRNFVATCDSFVWAEFFAGAKPLHPNQNYLIQIKESSDGNEIYSGNASADSAYQYVRAYLIHTNPNIRIAGTLPVFPKA